MRILLQRVKKAAVFVDGEEEGRIASGLLLFVGLIEGDGEHLQYMGEKVVNLRVFPDQEGRMNGSALQLKKEILVVPQFTLYADCRKGNRPGFSGAASPGEARRLFAAFHHILTAYPLFVAVGVFGANMQVELINDGPVTILLDTQELKGGQS